VAHYLILTHLSEQGGAMPMMDITNMRKRTRAEEEDQLVENLSSSRPALLMIFHKKHSKGQGMPSAPESSLFLATSNKSLHANPENLAVPIPEDLEQGFCFGIACHCKQAMK